MHTYAMTEELKSKTFTLNNKNPEQEGGIELTFTMEFKIQNLHFSENFSFRLVKRPFSANIRIGNYIRMPRLKK